jgi:hypothetical protein
MPSSNHAREELMSPAARTVNLFGIYLVAVGMTLVVIPDVLAGLFGIPPTDEPWIRILGLVVLVLAGYYLVAARSELTVFFRATVAGRVVAGAGLIVIVALWGYWMAVVVGLADIAGALWTRAALANEQPELPATPAEASDLV